MIATMVLLIQTETAFREPSYFAPVMLGMLVLGAVAWLIAAVLGFARAKAFGIIGTLVFILCSQLDFVPPAIRRAGF